MLEQLASAGVGGQQDLLADTVNERCILTGDTLTLRVVMRFRRRRHRVVVAVGHKGMVAVDLYP